MKERTQRETEKWYVTSLLTQLRGEPRVNYKTNDLLVYGICPARVTVRACLLVS